MSQPKAEVWLRGPLPDVPPLLQPVAHALLQAREELNLLMPGFPDDLLWERPAGLASPGFHLQHLTGVLDRLFTYASNQMLNEEQLAYLTSEGKPYKQVDLVNTLVNAFNKQVNKALDQIIQTKEDTLLQTRNVGRAQTPSTLLGLMVHAAEHTQRHYGQLLVTVTVIKNR